MKRISCFAVVMTVAGSTVGNIEAGQSSVANDARPEPHPWDKMISEWWTREEGLSQDGCEWQPSKGEDGNFYGSFGGWRIRDDQASLPMSEPVDKESERQRGTNLRIWNPDTRGWVMPWPTNAPRPPASFTPTSTSEEIVMLSNMADPQGFRPHNVP